MSLLSLEEQYSNNVVLKGLIQILSSGGLPIGSVIDSGLSTFLNNQKVKKLKIFFDKLNDGKVILDQADIENNDFLHAYFATVNYVLNTRTDEKAARFAEILKGLYSKEIDIDQFEDYSSIFNEISEREFYFLSKKMEYEQKYTLKNGELNEAQVVNLYWKEFKEEVINTLGIGAGEFDGIIIRVQRTGCFSDFKGYWENDHERKGLTTELFHKIYSLLNKEFQQVKT
jgi:hypothetical protein